MKKIISILCLMVIGIAAMAQSNTIKGTVKDSNGEPLIGVAVMLEGNTKVGTVTDVDGKYQLTLPSGKNHVIVFTSIGYKEFKTSNFTNDQEVMMKWITTSPSDGLYWQKYDDCCYKKLCEATDSSDSTTKYVIYQELFGRSRIFSMPIEEFYGTVEYQGKILKRFVEIDQEIALYQLP